ncbi:hypothetical protein CU097_011507 [Rhizopus azygosporus]|uniref:Uncharacterized protein n=1 Tax=Rhizopus azygosporus TaxID=86630 RepID=A0A367JIP5_RHIAZ|nr:hypothetical protein CU097_011507 [Rhizopus azygosporus]
MANEFDKTRKPYATCAYNFSLRNRDSDTRLDKKIQCIFHNIDNENEDYLSVHTLGTVSSFSDNRKFIAVDDYEFETERNSEEGLSAYSQFSSIQSCFKNFSTTCKY